MATAENPPLTVKKMRCLITVKLVDKVRCEWSIDNFRMHRIANRIGEKLLSSVFSAGSDPVVKFRVELYTVGSAIDQTLMSVAVRFMNSSQGACRGYVGFELSFIKNDGTEELVAETVRNFNNRSEWLNGNVLVGRVMPQILTVICTVNIFLIDTDPHDLEEVKVPECQLLQDVGQMLETPLFSDVTLVAGGREFPAHKVFLAARSPVFRAMFEHDMKEREQSRVEITDIDYRMLQAMLHFIYTGKVEWLDGMAHKLLAVADKYHLDRLKALCQAELCTGLNIDNCESLLAFADLHSADQLKVRALEFIAANAPQLVANTLRDLRLKSQAD